MAIHLSDPVLAAIDNLGVGDHRTIRRLVIDLQAGTPPVVHVEHYGDERILDVVRALEGVQIQREPAGLADWERELLEQQASESAADGVDRA